MANVTTYINKVVVPNGSDTITANLVDTVSGYTKNTGTITQVTAGAGLNTTSSDTSTDGGNITTSGTLYLTKSGVTAGTYHGLTVDKYGRITAANANTKFVTAVGLEKDVATFATGSGTSSSTNTDWLKGLSVSGTTLVVGAATLNTDSGLTADTLIVYTDEDESNLPAANGVGF